MKFFERSAPASFYLALVIAGGTLVGCANHHGEIATSSIHDADGKLGAARIIIDDPTTSGQKHFAAGRYGLAEQEFRKAITAQPDSAEAWLGLAATYDQLKRFDLAEQAYGRVLKLHGRSAEVLNNLGYHYIMRGNKIKARQAIEAASQIDPGNPQIQANLRLLEVGAAQSLIR